MKIEDIEALRDRMKGLSDDAARQMITTYVEENLDDILHLKHWLNGLHLKMFWEFLKKEMEERGLYGKCVKLEKGKVVEMPLDEILRNPETLRKEI